MTVVQRAKPAAHDSERDDGVVSVIDLQNLVKTFGPARALDGLDLRVEPGEVHGFVGPDGAGKSTTIRVLLGGRRGRRRDRRPAAALVDVGWPWSRSSSSRSCWARP